MLVSREEIGLKVEMTIGLNADVTWVWPNMVNLNVMNFSKRYEEWNGLWSEGSEWDGIWSEGN